MTVHTLHYPCGGEVTIRTWRLGGHVVYEATCDKCGTVKHGKGRAPKPLPNGTGKDKET